MCELRDFELPDSFIARMKAGELTTESAALVKDIAEQTGLSVEAAIIALAEEGMAALRFKGVLF